MACIAGVLPQPAAASARGKPCRDAVYKVNGNVYAQTNDLRAKRISCRSARRVALRWVRSSEGADGPARPYGYRCHRTDDVAITCRKGRRVASWYTINRFGP